MPSSQIASSSGRPVGGLADECRVAPNPAELRRRFDRDAPVTWALASTGHPRHVRETYAVTIRDGATTGPEEEPRRAPRGLMGAGTYVPHPQGVARPHAAFRDPEAGPRDWAAWRDGLCATDRRMLPFALDGANTRGLIRNVRSGLARPVEPLWWRFDARFSDLRCDRAPWRPTDETVRDQAAASGVAGLGTLWRILRLSIAKRAEDGWGWTD